MIITRAGRVRSNASPVGVAGGDRVARSVGSARVISPLEASRTDDGDRRGCVENEPRLLRANQTSDGSIL
jgi:hypothetical protein